MKRAILLCSFALLPLSAFAQEPATEPAAGIPATVESTETTVPVGPVEAAAPVAPMPPATETMDIESARRGLMFGGSTVGGVTLVAREVTMRSSLFTQNRSRLTRTFRYLGPEDAPILNGACILRTEGNSLLGFEWNQQTTQLYACAVEDQPEGQFAFEVAVPAFRESGFSLGGFSMSVQEDTPAEELQAILSARMVYRGVTYEARPTGFDDDGSNGFFVGGGPRRVVQGFTITRDGVEVGRVMFDMRNEGDGTITAPVADSDGREAVLFMAMQLHGMPDLYSPTVREEVGN